MNRQPPHSPISGGGEHRGLLLEKTRCHVYYVVLEPENLVRIVSVWGAMKGAGPSSIDR